jgi:hypothetical protein
MPKSYSQFKYEDVTALGLDVKNRAFKNDFAVLEPSAFLKQTIQINTKRLQRTEKAKSEFIIAPILYEIALLNESRVSFFSGYNLDVDKELGLKGFCDFLYSKVPDSPIISAPVFCVVEAKNDNLEKGVPQCIAEMYASKLFNKNQNKPIEVIYGCVTTGYQWQFLKLEGQTVLQDMTIYSINELPKILGILQFIVEQ